MATKSLTFDVFGRDRSASKTIRGVANETDRAAGRFKGFGVTAGVAIAAVGAAAVKFATDSVEAYAEAEESQNRLADAYERFPALADVSIESLRRYNEELAKKTRFDDDALAVGQSVLAQYGLTGEQLRDLTPLLADYAGKTKKDIPTAAEALGKALLGNGRSLKEVGIDFTDTGTLAGNLTQIMDGLRGQVGGFAEKDATTAKGKLDILRNAFGEVQEKVGESLMPQLEELVDWINLEGIPALEGFLAAMEMDGGKGEGPLAPNQDIFKKDPPDTREGPARLFGQITDLLSDPGSVFDDIADKDSLMGRWLPTREEWAQYWTDNKTISIEGVDGVRGGVGGGFSAMSGDMSVFRQATGEQFTGTWTDADGRTRAGMGTVNSSTGAGLGLIGGTLGGLSPIAGRTFDAAWLAAQTSTGSGWTGVDGKTRSGMGTVGTTLGGFRGVVQGPFSGVESWLFSSGQSVVQGFINGIKGMVGAVGSAVGGVVEWARSFFPNSPAERGVFSGAGWTALRDSGAAVIDQWQAGMDDKLAVALDAPAALVSASYTQASPSFNVIVQSRGGVDLTKYIEVVVEQKDSRDARTTRRYT